MRDYVIVNMTDPSEDDDVDEMIDQFIRDIEDGIQARCFDMRVSDRKKLFETEMRGMANE